MSRVNSERGAAALEFAFVFPFLLAILLGIVEMGLAFNAQVSVTHAAREAARTVAVHPDRVAAPTVAYAAGRTAARAAAPGLTPTLTDGEIAITTTDCALNNPATVIITHRQQFITGFFGAGVDIRGRAAMQCGG